MDKMSEKEKALAEISRLWDEIRSWDKIHSDNLKAACELSEKYNNRALKYWSAGDRNEFEYCCSMAHAAVAKYLDLFEAYRAKEKAFEQEYGHGWNCVAKNSEKEIKIEKTIEQMTDQLVRRYCKPGGCDACNLIDEYSALPLSCEDYLSYRKIAETFYCSLSSKKSM